METEVKYLLSGMLADFEEKLLAVYPDVQDLGTLQLPAIYYDSANGDLGQAHTALRVRSEGKQLIGCFKATTGELRVFVEEKIVLQRAEVETDWFTRLENYPRILEITSGAAIEPVLKIHTDRHIYLLKTGSLEVEIVLDRVNYLEGRAFDERVEVEMLAGTLEEFADFLHKFEQAIGGLRETQQSKYQKAKDLLNGCV